MLYFANYWGFPENDIINVNISEIMDSSIDLYENSFKKLQASPKNTDEISTNLKKVESLYNSSGLSNVNLTKGKTDPKKINDLSLEILTEMDYITGLYEALQD